MEGTKRIRKPEPLIRGARVFLRHPSKQDKEEFLAKVHASRRFLYPWVTPASTPRMFADYLRYAEREDVCALLVCRLDDCQIVGVINLSQIFRRSFQNAVLGFWAVAEFAGQGYMFEALRLAVRHSFTTLRLHRLEANIQPENVNSRKPLRHVRFRREGFSPRYLKIAGRWRDHDRWAICREDWIEHKSPQLQANIPGVPRTAHDEAKKEPVERKSGGSRIAQKSCLPLADRVFTGSR
jgi:[ribosomal protein S5]-alanine N-acetyltransferase